MKNYINLFAFFTIVFISSCKKNNNDNIITYKGTMREIVDNDPNFSFLKICLRKAALSPSIGVQAPPAITFFAPTNAAFTAAGITDTSKVSQGYLRKMLGYLIHSKDIRLEDSTKEIFATRMLDMEDSLYYFRSEGGYLLNGEAKANLLESPVSNGTMYSIDRIPLPAFGNILGTISSDSTYKFFSDAIFRVGDNDISLFINAYPSTLFVPTNNAIRKSVYDSTFFATAPAAEVLTVIKHHFHDGRKFSVELPDGNLPMRNGGMITVSRSGGDTYVKGNSNATPAKLISPNRIATKGIVHVIDQVLEP